MPTGKEAAHAQETLLETRMRVATPMCPNPNVPVNGRLPRGNDDTQGSFVADAYYAFGNIVRGLLAQGNHLVTRVERNSVAYYPATPPTRAQRRRK